MAAAKQCDNCGAFYMLTDADGPNAIRFGHVDAAGAWRSLEWPDLCPDCFKAVRMTLDNRKLLNSKELIPDGEKVTDEY